MAMRSKEEARQIKQQFRELYDDCIEYVVNYLNLTVEEGVSLEVSDDIIMFNV